ncbi:hypothetical protein [Dendronalium sp. ChiSLP03b]|uniref:hypothetical protein n=1 Tax=Dendronalium sp. ChiSLP03b TaxID=3075381 RepID=UPI002AD3CAAB|nr:hypothetical protein [Dendronalium sp. ChiSLP03b]MDZ8203506.1 hypothetical protein [Dendronalium sp. ChiSLP03b]
MTQLLKPLNSTHPEQLPDLSTPLRRKEQLEILLCQKVQTGEDISSCMKALQYCKQEETKQDQLQKMWTEVVKERSVFNSLQRVAITVFAILGMIAVFNGAFKSKNPSPAVIVPSGIHQK